MTWHYIGGVLSGTQYHVHWMHHITFLRIRLHSVQLHFKQLEQSRDNLHLIPPKTTQDAIPSAILDKHNLELVGIWEHKISVHRHSDMFSRLMARLSDRNEENHDLRKVLSRCYLKKKHFQHTFEKYSFMVFEGSSLGASSTLGFSHPESLTEEIPTKKSFLKVFLQKMTELFSSQLISTLLL